MSEAARDKHAIGFAQLLPRVVVACGVGVALIGFEEAGVDEEPLQLAAGVHRGVLEGLYHARVGFVGVVVFADERDGDAVEDAVLGAGELLPLAPDVLAGGGEGGGRGEEVEAQDFAELGHEALFFEELGDVVGGGEVVDGDYLFEVDLAEVGDFVDGGGFELFFTSAGNLGRSVRMVLNMRCDSHTH